MSSGKAAAIAFAIAVPLLVIACDIEAAREVANTFLLPDTGISGYNPPRIEGVMVKPEGFPLGKERR